MLRRRFIFLFFILILIFSLVFPGMALAEATTTKDTTSSTQQGIKQFRVEVSKKGFNNSPDELRLEVVEGQTVEITFVYADDASRDNQHIIFIGGYKIQTDTLGKDNPEVTVKFTADKTGEFPINCIMECAGHDNLQNGKLVVSPAATQVTAASTQDTTSSTQQGNKQFRVEVSKKGFNNSSEELRLDVVEGQTVEITFVYADDASQDNQHIFYISGYKIQTDTLSKDNPEVTVKFTADKTGEFSINCILECAGHNNLQNGKLVVSPAAAGSQPVKTTATTATLTMNTPDQAETGQPLTLTALVKDNLDKPVADAQVKFFIESDFFVKGMLEIGETVTNEQGLAKIDYIPNEAGVIHVVARYEAGSGSEPVETKREVNITGSSKSFYHTLIGIQFPNSFLIWMIALAVIVIGIWSTFLYVLSQVLFISMGTRTKRLVITLMIIVAVVCIILVQILLTPELQYHFVLLP